MWDGVAAAIDEIAGLDLGALSPAELSAAVLEHQRQFARLEAQAARVTAAWETRKAWQADGAKSGAVWLSIKARIPDGAARRRIRLGKALAAHPIVGAAWMAGDIDGAHVQVLNAACTNRTAGFFDRDEALLVDEATRLTFRKFTRAVDYWLLHADPDGAEDNAARQHDHRALHLNQSFDGRWFGTITLDPLAGTMVSETLEGIEQNLFDIDWGEARERLGRDPMAGELRRTPAQRRADALVEMAIRARCVPADGRRPVPLFTILIGWERFQQLCQTARGQVIAPGQLVDWLEDSYVERVVFDGPSRVVDLGVHQRLFRGGTERVVKIIGGECDHELCEEPADRCQTDHIEPWSAGGLTTQANGRPLCRFHNNLRNKRGDPPTAA
jgi:hypothetical protein